MGEVRKDSSRVTPYPLNQVYEKLFAQDEIMFVHPICALSFPNYIF